MLKLAEQVKIIPIGEGWAKNSVNAVIFRRNSLFTHQNTQYTAYYDPEQYLVLAKRKHGSEKWTTKRTAYKGKATDAHNTISIAVDGDGFLHVSWDHHGNQLRYARSTKSGGLELSEKIPMTGKSEDNVTYPEFYKMPDGNLLFFYRYGASGRGNLVINKYDIKTRSWSQLQNNLIDGEGERNAYWQACVDKKGIIHVSWVWRESPDVASNHDLCYARSIDGGKTWQNSHGEQYKLPINVKTAEIAYEISQNSELINQTSMTTDSQGNPVIATYWRNQNSKIPQYRLAYHNGQEWRSLSVSSRTTPFSLSGGGTKRIPISRPQVLLRQANQKEQAYLIYRDAERGDKVSVAICNDFPEAKWQVSDLTKNAVGSWEPSYDTEFWKSKGVLNLFVQKVEQVDSEGVANSQPETVSVLEWKPASK
ncbi:BNR repeat-containing protein [Pontibacter silvestris]|uniref:BNR repeat-containing protein n=1 Tax=Pontibacter silvestris TaxID=2305183 RepID=A0ABW4X0Y2_9BACT|nr:BNR repeat-containing protein [Pontibacter silvestris]MCC9135615.1 BNR repeat-containing protein [Pontibacter silvestris]